MLMALTIEDEFNKSNKLGIDTLGIRKRCFLIQSILTAPYMMDGTRTWFRSNDVVRLRKKSVLCSLLNLVRR